MTQTIWPERIILSRKGFDSSSGGTSSPIWPDGKMVSLPIPDRSSGIRYREFLFDGMNGEELLRIVHSWQCGDCEAHLDPDLRENAIARSAPWWPIFGQCGGAQSHLSMQGVAGAPCFDLFLFYGYYESLNGAARSLGFKVGHVIYGWLQIDHVQTVQKETAASFPEAARHPHVIGSERSHGGDNTLYFSTPSLTFRPVVAGGGVFPRYRRELCLSADPMTENRSEWISLFSKEGGVKMSRHRQEHVFSLQGPHEGEIKRWLSDLFFGAEAYAPSLIPLH